MPLSNCQFLHTPWLSVETVNAAVVSRDRPISAYDSVITIFLTQQVVDYISAVAVADILSGRIDSRGNCIIRHHCRGHSRRAFQLERALCERSEMCLERPSRINCVLSIIVMRIASSLFRTAARPMLDHRIHALISPSACDFILATACLKAVDICTRHVCIELRALSECDIEACPTRFCRKIDLWQKSCGNTQCPVLVGCNTAELLNQGRVERCRQTKRSRPMRNVSTGAIIIFCCRRSFMTRIRRYVNRDSMSSSFDKLLHVVAPHRCSRRSLHRCHKYSPEIVFGKEFLLIVCKIR